MKEKFYGAKTGNKCPKCGGTLIASNIAIATNPPIYSATCEICGSTFESYNSIGIVKNLYYIPNKGKMWESN